MGDKILDLRLAKLQQERLLNEAIGHPDRIRARLLRSAQEPEEQPAKPRQEGPRQPRWLTVLRVGAAAAIARMLWKLLGDPRPKPDTYGDSIELPRSQIVDQTR